MTWWDKVKGSNCNLACCFVLLLHHKVVVLTALHITSVCDLAPHQITNFWHGPIYIVATYCCYIVAFILVLKAIQEAGAQGSVQTG